MDAALVLLSDVWSVIATPFFTLGNKPISIIDIFLGFALLLASFSLARLGEKFIEDILKDKEIDQGIKSAIEKFTYYSIVVLGIIISVESLGINLDSLATVGGLFAVGIGFGVRNIAENFISGLIILLERPIKKGDIVDVKGVEGKVLEIRSRATLVGTRDDQVIIVPNSQFISEQVLNDSFSGERLRLTIKVGVKYGSDVELVKNILLNIAKDSKEVLSTPDPIVLFQDFGSSSLDFELRLWVREIWRKDVVKSDIRFAIDREFRAHNIEIPFPQRDLHFRSDPSHIFTRSTDSMNL